MIIRQTLAGLVALGLLGAPVAEAAPAPRSKPASVRKAGMKKPANGGVSVSGQDVDGVGTADVVVTAPPKPSPKKPKKKP